MLLALILSFSLADAPITGVVRDSSGGAVSGASVIVRAESGAEQQAVTGPDGRFSLDKVPPGSATLIVRAGGFAVKEQPLSGAGDLEVVLSPAPVLETVTVTPSRTEQRLGDVPASISVLDSEQIKASPALVADDVLRQIPTFSLFRRTSSLSSHPTSQGVSLRGIGPSGVSRTLVLADGIPQNDPFGGWVYWTRVALESVDRIEVVDGSTSSLYGNYAMGGVINIVSTRPARRTIALKPQYGNHNSPKLDFFGSDVWGKLGAALEGSVFDTDGFPIVIGNERGSIDNKAAVNFRNLNLKLDYTPTSRVSTFFRTGYFHENRDNAKISTFIPFTEEANDTTWKFVNGGMRVALPDSSGLQLNLFSDFETFHSNFLAVPAPTAANPVPRSVARVTLNQTVPVKDFGGMVQWSRAVGRKHYVSAGTDWRWADGDSDEDGLDAVTGTTVTLKRVSGGTQRSLGVFAQDIVTLLPELSVTIAVRVDHWRNYDAHNLETSLPSGTPTANNNPALSERSDTVASPRVAALYHLTDRVNVWGDVSSGFRAPTLNELYRQFRVGTTLTLANNNLAPERLVGGEGGVSVVLARNLTARATLFDNRVRNPVFNVTIATSPASITQQRQNIDRTEIRGLQADVEYRIGGWRVTGGYQRDNAEVNESNVYPVLVGKFLQQVPKNRGSVQVAYSNPKIATAAFDVQGIGAQFDDDLNTPTRLLPKYGVADLSVSRTIVKNFDVFFGVQNMFDKEYIVATLPTTIGTPRLVNGGLRVRWSGR